MTNVVKFPRGHAPTSAPAVDDLLRDLTAAQIELSRAQCDHLRSETRQVNIMWTWYCFKRVLFWGLALWLLMAFGTSARAAWTPTALADQVNAIALLAEHVTTCGGRPKPGAARNAVQIIEHIGYRKWFEIVSWVHLVRDADTESQFCSDARKLLAPMLEPVDYRPRNQVPPVSAELDLSELNRRLAGPPWCHLPNSGLLALANKRACE